MKDGFDTKELSDFENDLLKMATSTMPKESKVFLRKQGNTLRKETLSLAKARVHKQTGNLFKGIKRGKVYTYKGNGALSVRVYSGSPAFHAHLLEHGHRKVTKDGKEVGFVQGEHFFEDAAKQFENTYADNVQDFIDDMLDKGLSR